jgi:cysteine desulfurase
MIGKTVYFDYAATSPVDPRVAAAMAECLELDGDFANPSSTHRLGLRAGERVERARAEVAERVGCGAAEITFTSGATESTNLALKGWFGDPVAGGARLITTRIEHKSVLDCAKVLESKGTTIEFVATDSAGRVDIDHLRTLLRRPAALVSVAHVNNEIGTRQDIALIAEVCHEHGVALHVDAAQSVGKVPLELERWGVTLCSLTAHKIYGPKGIGAIYVRPGTKLVPQMHGGSQERGLRAGTLPTHQIVGLGRAYALADPAEDGPRLAELGAQLRRGLEAIPDVQRNGAAEASVPNIVNIAFPGVEGESLRLALEDIALSAGSACNSAVPEPSYVLTSVGRSDVLAGSSLRFSIGRFTTREEVAYVIDRVTDEVARLRNLAPSAPAWCAGGGGSLRQDRPFSAKLSR